MRERHQRMRNISLFVLENDDLIREIGSFIATKLPFLLTTKRIYTALKPVEVQNGEIWIESKKKEFVNSIQMVQWVESQGCVFAKAEEHYFEEALDNSLCRYASTEGNIEVLKWALNQNPPYSIGLGSFVTAIRHGHVEILDFLHKSGFPTLFHHFSCYFAVDRGHFHVLQWLRAQNPPYPWDPLTCNRLAMLGDLKGLKWVRSQNPPCPWDQHTCTAAVVGNHLEILKWLRVQLPPCAWESETCLRAAENGNPGILKWLRGQVPPCPWNKMRCLREVRRRGYTDLESWITQQANHEDDEFDHFLMIEN